MKKYTFIAVLCAAFACFATPVDRDLATRAAEGFLSKSSFAQRILEGRTVSSVEQRDAIYIAHLAPSGHIILAGTTKLAPIISISPYDFIEPVGGDPVSESIESYVRRCAAVEADDSRETHSDWSKYTSAKKRRLLGGALNHPPEGEEGEDVVIVGPILGTAWDQLAPWNDLTPLNCYCGCSATAGGQELAYWKWPYRMEMDNTFVHNLNGVYGYINRMNGSVPFNWDKVYGGYEAKPTYQIDDKKSTYECAHVITWVQTFVDMNIGNGGSGATRKLCQSAITNDLFEAGTIMSKGRNGYDALWSAITNDIAFGSPINVNSSGHQMVVDGYAIVGEGGISNQWINLNKGWKNSVAWVVLDEEIEIGEPVSGQLADFQIGFRPKKRVQFETVPKISNGSVNLVWHLPRCYTNRVDNLGVRLEDGFELVVSSSSKSVTNFIDSIAGTTVYTNEVDVSGYSGEVTFTVTPKMSDGSDAVATSVKTTIGESHAMPEITCVSAVGGGLELLQEGFYIECGRGVTNTINVTCSESTTGLKALSAQLSVLPDEKVSIITNGHEFTVCVDATEVSSKWDNDMILLTLVASNADYTEVSKNLMLRFNSTRNVLRGTYEVAADSETNDPIWLCRDNNIVLDAKGHSITYKNGSFMGAGAVTLTDTVGGGSFTFENLGNFTGVLAWGTDVSVSLPVAGDYACELKPGNGVTISSLTIPTNSTLRVESGVTNTLSNVSISKLVGEGVVLVSSGESVIDDVSGFNGGVGLSGGTLTINSGAERFIDLDGGILKIKLTMEQTYFGYSATLNDYSSGSVQFVEYSGGEPVSALRDGNAFTFAPTANIWRSSGTGSYSDTSCWSLGRLPTTGEYVIFRVDSADGATLQIDDEINLGGVVISGSGPLTLTNVTGGVSAVFKAEWLEPYVNVKISDGCVLECEVDIKLKEDRIKTSSGTNALIDSDKWHGTICYENIQIDNKSYYSYNDYGNVNSKIRFSGVTGFFGIDADNVYNGAAFELKDSGETPAIHWNNGWGGKYRTQTIRAFVGDGTLKTSGFGANEKVLINDLSGFFGSFNLNSKSVAIGASMPSKEISSGGRLMVCEGAVATNTIGKTWFAKDGVYVAGDLTVKGMIDTSSVCGFGVGGVLNLAEGGIIEVDSISGSDAAMTRNYGAGTFRVTADMTENHVINFCATNGESYTTLDANGHVLTFGVQSVTGKGAIHPVSSAAGGHVVFKSLDGFEGSIIADNAMAATLPDLSRSAATLELSTELTLNAGMEGKVRIKNGGVLKLLLTGAQILYQGYTAEGITVEEGGALQFVDSHGTPLEYETVGNSYIWTANPSQGDLSNPVPTAVWETGGFEIATNGYSIDLNHGNSISGGNILIGNSATNGVTIHGVNNQYAVSLLIKYSNAIVTGANSVFACFYAHDHDTGLVTDSKASGELTGYYDNKKTYRLSYGDTKVKVDPAEIGSGTLLFSYKHDDGLNGYNGITAADLAGGNNGGLKWSGYPLQSLTIGGPTGRKAVGDTYAVWPNLVIEKVALFVGNAYTASQLSDFVWPSEKTVAHSKYTRTVSDGTVSWSDAAWSADGVSDSSWVGSLSSEAEVTVTDHAVLTLPPTLIAKKLVFNISEGVTLRLTADSGENGTGITASEGIIANGGTLQFSGTLTVPAISGSSAIKVVDGSTIYGPFTVAAQNIPSVVLGNNVTLQTVTLNNCSSVTFGTNVTVGAMNLNLRNNPIIEFSNGMKVSSLSLSSDLGGVTLTGVKPTDEIDFSGVAGQVVYPWHWTGAVSSHIGGLTLTGGSGSAESYASFSPTGGSIVFTNGTHYLSFGHSATQTAIEFSDADVYVTNGFLFGEATVTVGGSSRITTDRVILSQGDNGRATSLTLRDSAVLTVTSASVVNADNNTATIMFGHWNGPSTFTLGGNAQFNAAGVDVLVGLTGNNQTINIAGGVFDANGIKLSSNATGNNSLALSGGEMRLGATGITSYGSGTMPVVVSGDAKIATKTAGTPLPITQAVSVLDGTTLTLGGGGTVEFTKLDIGSNATLVLTNGTKCILHGGSIAADAKFTFGEGTEIDIEEQSVYWGSLSLNLTAGSATPTVKILSKGGSEISSTATKNGNALSIEWRVPSTTGEACWFDYELNGSAASTGYVSKSLTASETIQYRDASYLYTKSVPWINGDVNYPDGWTAAFRGTIPKGVNTLLLSFGTNGGGIIGLASGAATGGEYNTINIVRTTGNLQHSVLGSFAIPNASTMLHTYIFVETPDGVTIYCDGTKVFPSGSETSEALAKLKNLSFGNHLQIGSIHGGVGNTGLSRIADLNASVKDDCILDFLRLYDFAADEGHEMMSRTWAEYPTSYMRTVSSNCGWVDSGAWIKGALASTDWVGSESAVAEVTVTNNAALTLLSELTASNVTFNINSGVTLTLRHADGGTTLNVPEIVATGAGNLVIGEGLAVSNLTFSSTGSLTVSYGASLYVNKPLTVAGGLVVDGDVFYADGAITATVTGSGTVEYEGSLPPSTVTFTDPSWSGTLSLRNIRGTRNDGLVSTELTDITTYGNINSKVSLTDVQAYLRNNDETCSTTILLLDGDHEAWENDNGWTNRSGTFSALAGTGTFLDTRDRNSSVITFTNVTNFAGSILTNGKRIMLGNAVDSDTITRGSIAVGSSVTNTIASGKTWQSGGEFVIKGHLTNQGTISITNATAKINKGGNETTNVTLKVIGTLVNEGTIDVISPIVVTGVLDVRPGKTINGNVTLVDGATLILAEANQIRGALTLENGSTVKLPEGTVSPFRFATSSTGTCVVKIGETAQTGYSIVDGVFALGYNKSISINFGQNDGADSAISASDWVGLAPAGRWLNTADAGDASIFPLTESNLTLSDSNGQAYGDMKLWLGSRGGNYLCSSGSTNTPTASILYRFIDDTETNAQNASIKVTHVNDFADKYSVYIYFSKDPSNNAPVDSNAFSPYFVNGVPYYGNGSTTLQGHGLWGALRTDSLVEGVNALVVRGLTNDTLVVVQPNVTGSRKCIAGIQIVAEADGTPIALQEASFVAPSDDWAGKTMPTNSIALNGGNAGSLSFGNTGIPDGQPVVANLNGGTYGDVFGLFKHGESAAVPTNAYRDIYLMLSGNATATKVGGVQSLNYEGTRTFNTTGDALVQICGAARVAYAFGAGCEGGGNGVVKGNTGVTIKDGAVLTGSAFGGWSSQHGSNRNPTVNCNTSVKVLNVQSDNSAARESNIVSGAIVGGSVYGWNHNSKATIKGNSSVIVDLSDLAISGETNFVKQLIGGCAVLRNDSSYGGHNGGVFAVSNDTSVVVTAPNNVVFTGDITGGGYIVDDTGDTYATVGRDSSVELIGGTYSDITITAGGKGTKATVAGDATLTIRGGVFDNVILSGGNAEGTKTLVITEQSDFDGVIITDFNLVSVTGGEGDLYSLPITNVNTTAGILAVSNNAKVVFSNTGSWRNGTVVVGNNGYLESTNPIAVANLSLQNGATIVFPTSLSSLTVTDIAFASSTVYISYPDGVTPTAGTIINWNAEPSGNFILVGDTTNNWMLVKSAAGLSITNIVAKIGAAQYASLSEAVAAAGDNVITLMANTDEAIVLPAGQTVRIKKNDFSCDVTFEGMAAEATSDTVDGVTTYTSFVAKAAVIGGTASYYASLSNAVEAASSAASVTNAVRLFAADSGNIVLTGKTIIFEENGYAFSGTLTGNGTLMLTNASSATTWSVSRFDADGWTGALALNNVTIAGNAWDSLTGVNVRASGTLCVDGTGSVNFGLTFEPGSTVRYIGGPSGAGSIQLLSAASFAGVENAMLDGLEGRYLEVVGGALYASLEPEAINTHLTPIFGPQAVAVWDGNFSTNALAANSSDGYTLVNSNATHGLRMSSVTIDQNDHGLMFDSANAMDGLTVLVRYSNLTAGGSGTNRVLFTSSVTSTHQYDRAGIQLQPDGKLVGLWNISTNSNNNVDNGTASGSIPSNGVMAFTYSTGGTYLYYGATATDIQSTAVWGSDALKSSNDTAIYGAGIGGMYHGGSKSNTEAAKGMTIEAVAVFDEVLTVNEMNEYIWPSYKTSTTNVTGKSVKVSELNNFINESGAPYFVSITVDAGATIVVDEAFSEASGIIAIKSEGSITLSAESQPPASWFANVDFSGVKGSRLRSWLEPGIVGFNFNSANGTDTSVAIVTGGNWFDIASDKSGTTTNLFADGLSMLSWSSATCWSYGTAGNILSGYLDDGSNHGHGAEIILSGVPYEAYDVIIYAATDSGDGFLAKTVNGTNYTWSAGAVVEGTNSWGTPRQSPAAYGTNAMRIKNLSGPLTIYGGARAGNYRGGISAIQIMPHRESTVRFNNDDSRGALSGTAEQTISYGEKAVEPNVTPNPGWNFNDWNGDATAAITADTTFTAQYTPIEYEITYTGLKEGADNTNPTTFTVTNSITFTALENVEGWDFKGWSPASIPLGTTSNVTVTANWVRPTYECNINGVKTPYTYGDEVKFTAPEPTEADGVQTVYLGTTFTKSATNEFSYRITGSISFTWDILATNYMYETSATSDGAIVGAPADGWLPDGTHFTLTAVADANYHLVAWTGNTNGCEVSETTNLVVRMDSPRTIGATFAIDRYTVTFVDYNGTEISSADYDHGTAAANIAKPADPTRAATEQYTYTFNGWSPAITDVTSDATYTATYTSLDNHYYTITPKTNWFTEDAATGSVTNTPGSRFSTETPSVVEGALQVDTLLDESLFYTPPEFSGSAATYRIETVIKELTVNASTNALPIYEGEGNVPYASIAAAQNEGYNYWYAWNGATWTNLNETIHPSDGGPYTNVIEFTVNASKLNVAYSVNGQPLGTVVHASATELPSLSKLGFSGYGKFGSFSGDGFESSLTLMTTKSREELIDAGLVLDGFDDDVESALAYKDANGLYGWQKLVLGMRTDSTEKPYAAPVQNSSPGSLSFKVGNCRANNNFSNKVAKFQVYEVDAGTYGEKEEGCASGPATVGEEATITLPNDRTVRYFKIRITFE